MRKAPKRNLRDLIGNIKKSVSSAAVFEVLLARTLVAEFGESNVHPYPHVERGTGKSVDFAVQQGVHRVYFEATILLDDRDTQLVKDACLKNCVSLPIRNVQPDELVNRILLKCKSKVLERKVKGPLVLCLNLLGDRTRPPDGISAMSQLMTWNEPGSEWLVAGACYWQDFFQRYIPSARVKSRHLIPTELMDRVGRALAGY